MTGELSQPHPVVPTDAGETASVHTEPPSVAPISPADPPEQLAPRARLGTDSPSFRSYFRTLRHDARTPVNHILGYCELLLEEAEGQEQGDLVAGLHRMHMAGKRLLALITEQLDPAKLEAGTLDLARLRQELSPPVNEIIGLSIAVRDDAHAGGREEIIPDLERIRVAAEQLRTTINNIEPAASEPLPASPAAPTPTDLLPVHPLESAGSRPMGERRAFAPGADYGSLLIVDDDEMNRDMLSRRLERLGYTVSCVESGHQALALMQTQAFDLMLLDILMPEMNGYQVLEQLQAAPNARRIPVIVLSALDEVDSVVRCIEMGAEDYLSKPFDPVLLQARIGASLEKKRLRDQEVLYLQQVARVTTAAAAVEAASYDPASLREVSARTDALGQLARVFQRMAHEVYAREQRLKEQVRELRIEIDQARKAREVAEITETEYFQQLRRKAHALRGATKQPGAAG